jgi:hypothetical protein
MGRRTDRHGVEARRGQQGDRRSLSSLQHQCERARPETRGKQVGRIVPLHAALGVFDTQDMADQGIELRPPLGLEDCRNSAFVRGVAAQAVHRLGRKGDQAALLQVPRRLGDGLRRRLENGHPRPLLRAMKCGLEKRGLP